MVKVFIQQESGKFKTKKYLEPSNKTPRNSGVEQSPDLLKQASGVSLEIQIKLVCY